MAQLTIIIEIDNDPTLNDPLVVAEDIIGAYNEDREHTYAPGPEAEVLSAEWI